MESQQRVARRNWIFWRVLGVLAVVAAGLFVYTIVQQNLAASATPPDKGPVQLLDVQSATTALLATVGAMVARAQYATVVRPLLGFQGRVVKGLSPKPEALVWASRVLNGAESGATVREVRYRVRPAASAGSAAPAAPAESASQAVEGWLGYDAVQAELRRIGLRTGVDFALHRLGEGAPLVGQDAVLLGWFTPRAMSLLAGLGVQVRVRDRVGDEHERSVDMLKGADRAPRTEQSW